MTYTPTHRTEILDEKLRKCVPEPQPVRVATEPGRGFDEAAYIEGMRGLAGTKGHKAKLPTVYGSSKTGDKTNLDVGPEILKVLVGKMRATEIAKAVSASLGRPVRHQTVSDRLNNQLKDDVVQIRQSKNNVFWRLK